MIASTHNNGTYAIKRVLCNHKELKNVVYADTDNGFAVIHKVNEEGRIVVKDGVIQCESVVGQINLDMNDGWAYCSHSDTFKPVY